MRPILLILSATAISGYAQNFAVGVAAGTNLTSGYESIATPIVGAMVEWSLPRNFGLEIDGLWHTYPIGGQAGTEVTWEFPVLARYSFPLPFGAPFIEGGPSFRTGERSISGFSGGGGIEFRVTRNLSIVPEFRYSHWGYSNPRNITDFLNPNQVEFLTAFSSSVPRERISNPLGGHVSLGIVLGATLTSDFRSVSSTGLVQYGIAPPFTATTVSTAGPASLLIGPSIEFRLPFNVSIEANAIRRSIPQGSYLTIPNGSVGTSTLNAAGLHVVGSSSAGVTEFGSGEASGPSDVTWNFPVLAKYRFPMSWATPLVELGPSFRLPQNVNGGNLSTFGITAGAGIEVHLLHLAIAPELRFTHWSDGSPQESTRFIPNQLEFLTAVSVGGPRH